MEKQPKTPHKMYRQGTEPELRSKRKYAAACESCHVEGLFQIYALKPLRQTPGVEFHSIPPILGVNAMDRVIHTGAAQSPGPVKGPLGDDDTVERPWYMHPHQDDNLAVLSGKRFVDLYSVAHGKIESFTVEPNRITMNGKLIFDGAAILAWPINVFHRIRSDPDTGSASINLAVHYDGFDIDTEFNVYDLNPETGEYRVVRKGAEDQPGGVGFQE